MDSCCVCSCKYAKNKKTKISNAYCRTCKKRGPFLHACLECVYFGCHKHIREHTKNQKHCFSVELTYGQIHCASCNDYIYDADIDEITMENKMQSKKFKKRLFDWTSWDATEEERDLLTRRTKRICITPESTIGLRGLLNLGSTCFMNCIVQALMHTPFLRDYFLTERHKCNGVPGTCLVCEVSKLFQEFYGGARVPLVLHELLHLIWTHARHLAGYEQQDAHEFFIATLNILHKHCLDTMPKHSEVPQTENGKCPCIIDQIFTGGLQSDLVCQKCSGVSTTIDPIWDFSLDLGPVTLGGRQPSSLHECLERFTRAEHLGSKAKIMCSNCGSYQESTKQLTLKTLPIVVSFHLKRFQHSNEIEKKISTVISFPEMLDMTPFMSRSKNESPFPSDNRYSLFAVINHLGTSINVGHYTAYVRQQRDYWYKCDDHVITRANLNEVLDSEGLVHLDLKGAPPKLCFYEKFLPFIKDVGATGILLEWEDTFPYTKELIQIGGLSNSAQVSGAPYTLEEARQILDLAVDYDLTVIPLVQTFGHMEFALKHEQWRGLREVEAYPSSMCPSNSETMLLIRSLIKQVVSFHPSIQYLHIGGDEIWHMGLCPVCQKRVQTCKFGKAGLYLDHVTKVAQYIKDNYSNLKIIIWDDMFRNIELNILQDYYIGNLVEPMIWNYNSAETFQLGGVLWEKYSNIFSNVWGATAFKGATSSCQLIPMTKYHMSNHEAWLTELGIHAGKILNFRGIVLTGWSRFDHYATLCELLPCAVPSLCICLKTWLAGGYSQELHDSVGKLLGYNDNFPNFDYSIIRSPLPLPQLSFPGWQIFVGFEWLSNLRARYKNIVNSDQIHTWFNAWQVANNYTNPMQIDTIMPVISDILNEVISIENYLKGNLDHFFFNHTIEEIIGTLIVPIKQHLKQIKADCETQLSLGCRVRGYKRLNL